MITPWGVLARRFHPASKSDVAGEAIALAKGGGADFLPARRLVVKRAHELGEDALAIVPSEWLVAHGASTDGRHTESSPSKPSAAEAAAEAAQWGGTKPTTLDDAGTAAGGPSLDAMGRALNTGSVRSRSFAITRRRVKNAP